VRELELKFAVDDSFQPPTDLPPASGIAGVDEGSPLELEAAYSDTTGLRLARHGITLRFRTGDEGGPRWTLKFPMEEKEGSEREELEFDGAPGRPPQQARDLVRAYARTEPLRHVVAVRTRRRAWSLRDVDGHVVAEMVDDRVTLLKDRRVVERFREIELESKGLNRKGLEAVAKVLEKMGAGRAPDTPKAIRALGPPAQAGPDVSFPDRISPSEPSGEAVKRAIASAFRRLQANDWRARIGDQEAVHQMRVAARHVRSDLKTMASLVTPEWAEGLREELKWVGSQLGDLRDLDVLIERLQAAAADLKDDLVFLFEELDRRSAQARENAMKELRSYRYDQLLDAWVDGGAAPSLEPSAAEPCAEALPPLVARRWGKLKDAVAELAEDAPHESWHKVRIRAKQARYAAEAVAPAIGKSKGSQAAVFAKLCSKVQDTLGTNQDASVAMRVITEVADSRSEDARFNRAAGRLLERQEDEARTARKAFWKAWDQLDRKRNRTWMAV
jgi:inorganic triphosphatase YgiF